MKHTKKMYPAALLLGALALGGCGEQASAASPSASPTAAPAKAADESTLQGALLTMGLSPLADKPQAIEVSLPSLAGSTESLSAHRGQWILLNFWATWCPPCRAEMPSIESLWKDYQSRGLVILAVSSGEEPSTVKTFIAQNKYTFPILLDTQGQAGYQYSVESIPTTYLIDPEGRVVGGVMGSHDWNSPGIRSGLDSLLGK